MAKKHQKKNESNIFPPNLYKVGNSWMIEFVFKGRRYRENIGGVAETIAAEKVGARKTEVRNGKRAIDGMRWINDAWEEDSQSRLHDLQFEAALEKYLEWYKANRKPRSYRSYAKNAATSLEAFFKGKRLSQITPFLIESYKFDRKRGPDEKEPDKKSVTDATVNRSLTLLKHLFNLSIKWKFAKVNPMEDVQLFKEDNGRTRYLSQLEAERLLAACNHDFRVVVLAALHTGFRSSELKSLTWTNVDLVNRSITVASCYSKNGETRTVPLTKGLGDVLASLHSERKPNSADPVFTHDGKAWHCWKEAFKGAVVRAKLRDFRFHDLRHCYGSWLAMNNVPDKGRMELMGHKDPKMTMRYTHLSMEFKRQAVEKLPSFDKRIMDAESPQISPSEEKSKVLAFSK